MAETQPAEPTFHYRRPGLTFEVYANRIEIAERGGMLGMGGKKISILLRNVADVQVEGFTKQLTIRTTDGKAHKWQLGGDGEKARQAIVELL